MRGKPARGPSIFVILRLIPARAGKTCPCRWHFLRVAAHPRACGENSRAASIGATLSGSSPRVRGKRPRAPCPERQGGLIPARAGKTPITDLERRGPRAHPRACGENDITPDNDKGHGGSSPRVRGKLMMDQWCR